MFNESCGVATPRLDRDIPSVPTLFQQLLLYNALLAAGETSCLLLDYIGLGWCVPYTQLYDSAIDISLASLIVMKFRNETK